MFAVRTEKVLDDKQSQCMLWMLRNVDFDFEIFCKSIINNRESFKVTGLLDHNFTIYRMSDTWRKLISPVDKFFHSGVIWDKLRIISESYSEITHIEIQLVQVRGQRLVAYSNWQCTSRLVGKNILSG